MVARSPLVGSTSSRSTVSGVITEADHQNRTRAQLRPYLDHAIESFGFDRLMYGSDWPVSEQTHRYSAWVAILDDLTTGCSTTEIRNLLRNNAIAFYRLEPPPLNR